jgi:hypothetical protein
MPKFVMEWEEMLCLLDSSSEDGWKHKRGYERLQRSEGTDKDGLHIPNE